MRHGACSFASASRSLWLHSLVGELPLTQRRGNESAGSAEEPPVATVLAIWTIV